MPASSSTAVPITRRRKAGQSSTRKKATPNEIGTAMTSASSATNTVSTISEATPNEPCTGSQSELTKNPSPNFANAGQPPIASDTSMPPSAANSIVAAARQTYSKNRSSSAPLGCLRTAATAAGVAGLPAAMTVRVMAAACPLRTRRSWVDRSAVRPDDRAPRSADRRLHGVWQRHVVEAGGGWIAVLVGPVEERQHVAAGLGVRLFLVHQDEGRARD